MRTEQITFDVLGSIGSHHLSKPILLTILPDEAGFTAAHSVLPITGTGKSRKEAIKDFEEKLVQHRDALAAKIKERGESSGLRHLVQMWQVFEGYWGDDGTILILQE